MHNIETIITRENIRVTSEFVPCSQSRNKDAKDDTLNWKVTLWRGDVPAVTTDYSAGYGHCYAYKKPPRLSSGKVDEYLQRLEIAYECETGYVGRASHGGYVARLGKKQTQPNETDVLYSLIRDADVLDYPDFEAWADEFGYDADSRKAEKIYNACLSIALKVRSVFGAALIAELRDAFQDY